MLKMRQLGLSRLLACIVASMFMCSISGARANPIVIQSGGVASEVDGIVVTGITYNVTFLDYSSSFTGETTFDGDSTNAALAGQALIDALNTASAFRVLLPNISISANHFLVEDNGRETGIQYSSTAPGQGVQPWHSLGDNVDSFIATFAEVAVPGPIAGAGLPGLILASAGLLAWWRRRREKSAAG